MKNHLSNYFTRAATIGLESAQPMHPQAKIGDFRQLKCQKSLEKCIRAPTLSARGLRGPRGVACDANLLEAGIREKLKSAPDADFAMSASTPVFLESHIRPKEWDMAWTAGTEDTGKKKASCRAPYALVQHYAPGLNPEATFKCERDSNFVRILGVFESATLARALVDAITCPVRNNFPVKFRTRTWQKFCGRDAFDLAKSYHFILLFHDQPIEVFAIDAAELPNHCPNQPSGMGNYPPGCKVSQQEYGVVRFRPWWSRAPAAENRRRPTPSFSKRLVHASDRLVAELGAVQEVHACFITRRLAEEHALETLNAFIQDSGSIDGGTKIHADLMAVVKLYDWLQLRPEGGNDILWQDMRLRRTLLIRREDSERHQPPQRKPEKDETNAQVDERQLCEALHRVRQGKFEIKQEATLRLRSSNVQGDEKASAIEARLNRLRHHVANTNTGLQDLNKMRIISGSARRATKATSQVET